jgi:hypothetical protein
MSYLKKKYKTMTSANKFISSILNKYNEDINITNEHIFEIIKYHPTKKLDRYNIEWLRMIKRPPYNSLALHYKDKSTSKIDDISWKLCIRNLYGKYDNSKEKLNNIILAFRNEIHFGSKKKYFIDNTKKKDNKFFGVCDNCNLETININTDHYPVPYKKIFENFISNNKILLNTINVFENYNNELRLKNRELALIWLQYHDSNSKYRLLCKSCNSHFGSYNY